MSTHSDIETRIDLLVKEIQATPLSGRGQLIARHDGVIAAVTDQGPGVSAAMRSRLEILTDETLEDQFDNLPL